MIGYFSLHWDRDRTGTRQGPPPITSPEILPDGRVTFRLLAPEATSVSVTGDWPGGIHSTTTPMVKDDKGVWSATVGPLKPEFWIYTFSVNGVTTLDPRNINTRRNTAKIENTLLIPGPESADYMVNAVPHGTVSLQWYPSPRWTRSGAPTCIRRPATRRERPVSGAVPAPRRKRRRGCVVFLRPGDPDSRQPDRPGQSEADDRRDAQRQHHANRGPRLRARPARAPGEPGPRPVPEVSRKAWSRTWFRSSTRPIGPGQIGSNRAIAGCRSAAPRQCTRPSTTSTCLRGWRPSAEAIPSCRGSAIDVPPPPNAASLKGPDITKSLDPVKFAALMPQLMSSANDEAAAPVHLDWHGGHAAGDPQGREASPEGKGREVHAHGVPGLHPRVAGLASVAEGPAAEAVPTRPLETTDSMKLDSQRACAVLLLVARPCFAQEPPATSVGTRGGQAQAAAVRSPEVLGDGRVTFRLFAPKAAEVLVQGNWQGGRDVKMTKDDSGLWSVTTAAAPARALGVHVIGERRQDARSAQLQRVRDGVGFMNTVLVPGDASAVFQARPVPHGTMTATWFQSAEHEGRPPHVRLHPAWLRGGHDQVPGVVPAPRQRRRRGGMAGQWESPT